MAVAVVERIAQAVRATAYVEGRVPGSGVLMRGALLTNNHVLVGLQNDRPASPDDARNVVARLNFQDAPDGTPLEPADVRLEPEQLLHVSVDLDYALVGLDSSVNQAWGHVPLVGSGELDIALAHLATGHLYLMCGSGERGPGLGQNDERCCAASSLPRECVRHPAAFLPAATPGAVGDRSADRRVRAGAPRDGEGHVIVGEAE